MPFFSIVLPTYNRAAFVPTAIRSVLEQSDGDWELLIVDDGSTDGTRETVAPFLDDPRIRYHWQANAERCAARNKGISLATGEYVCFLDSDDVYLPDHLATLRAAIGTAQEKVAFFYTFAEIIDGGAVRKQVVLPENSFVSVFQQLILDSVCTNGICIHRDILEKYSYDTRLTIGEDSHLYLRIAKEFPVVRIAAHTHRYVFHDENSVRSPRRLRNLESRVLYLTDVLEDPVIRAGFPKGYNERRIAQDLEWLSYEYSRDGRRSDAVRTFLRARRWSPEGWGLPQVRTLAMLALGKVR